MSEAAPDAAQARLAGTIEAIERAYEYLLAYAAQGRRDDAGTEARAMLESLHASLAEIGPLARAAFGAAIADQGTGPTVGPTIGQSVDRDVMAYLAAVDRDADIARGAVALVLSRPRLGSLLVDNLNASVHLRALLTDAFLLDQALENS